MRQRSDDVGVFDGSASRVVDPARAAAWAALPDVPTSPAADLIADIIRSNRTAADSKIKARKSPKIILYTTVTAGDGQSASAALGEAFPQFSLRIRSPRDSGGS